MWSGVRHMRYMAPSEPHVMSGSSVAAVPPGGPGRTVQVRPLSRLTITMGPQFQPLASAMVPSGAGLPWPLTPPH
jgi:hypothetical protein